MLKNPNCMVWLITLTFLIHSCGTSPFVPVTTPEATQEIPFPLTATPFMTSEILATPVATQRPDLNLPTITPSPSASCYDTAFVRDVSIPDGMLVDRHAVFLKIWRVKNTGDCPWPQDLILEFVGGDRLGTSGTVSVALYPEGAPIIESMGERAWADLKLAVVTADEIVDLPLMLHAPGSAGDYVSLWSLRSRETGHELTQLYVQVRVEEPEPAETALWSGEWIQKNQHIGMDPTALFIQQRGSLISGYFYSPPGELYLLEGGVFDQGSRVSGTFGPPYHDGFPFEWRFLDGGKVFQGVYQDQVVSRGAWCGARAEVELPFPCELNR